MERLFRSHVSVLGIVLARFTTDYLAGDQNAVKFRLQASPRYRPMYLETEKIHPVISPFPPPPPLK